MAHSDPPDGEKVLIVSPKPAVGRESGFVTGGTDKFNRLGIKSSERIAKKRRRSLQMLFQNFFGPLNFHLHLNRLQIREMRVRTGVTPDRDPGRMEFAQLRPME